MSIPAVWALRIMALHTALTVLLSACTPENTAPLPHGPALPIGAPRSAAGPSARRPTAQPLQPSSATVIPGLGGREVELSVNGERVRVLRPSLAHPFVVAGAEYESTPAPRPPSSPDDAGPTLEHLQHRTIDVIRGVPQTVDLRVADPQGVGDIRGYYVEFEGYPGAFYVPSEIDSEVFGDTDRERGRTSIGFFMDEIFPPGARRDAAWAAQYQQPFDVQMRIWAIDRRRHLSPAVQQTLHVLPVGSGDLEVTLSMSMATDLDLYVLEPNGNVIYYNNMRSYTNGQLDLDANAACNSNRNVRYEHIFWPQGQVPEGRYQIRVDNWANCVGGQDVDFEVIVQNCGDISVHQGTARGQGGRGDCRNPLTPSCQTIATVDVGECETGRAGGSR